MTAFDRGLLLDADGVLFDSSEAQRENWRWWGERRHLNPEQMDLLLNGMDGVRARDKISRFRPNITPAELAREVGLMEEIERANASKVVALPGAKEALSLADHGRPLAVITSGSYALIVARLTAAKLPVPELMVSAETTGQGKPHGEPFLKGAELLHLPPQQCDAAEDSDAGIASALAAGVGRVFAINPDTDSGPRFFGVEGEFPNLLKALPYVTAA